MLGHGLSFSPQFRDQRLAIMILPPDRHPVLSRSGSFIQLLANDMADL